MIWNCFCGTINAAGFALVTKCSDTRINGMIDLKWHVGDHTTKAKHRAHLRMYDGAVSAQLTESSHAHHDRLGEARGRWVLAEVLRRMGDLENAEPEIQTALGMVLPLEHPGALATLSALRLAQGRAGEALAAAEDAMARCETLGGCGMFRGAFVRLAHAEALHATGAHDAARRAIAGAREHLLAIAGKIADPDYKASFLERVPENARTLALADAWLGDPAPPRPGE